MFQIRTLALSEYYFEFRFRAAYLHIKLQKCYHYIEKFSTWSILLRLNILCTSLVQQYYAENNTIHCSRVMVTYLSPM